MKYVILILLICLVFLVSCSPKPVDVQVSSTVGVSSLYGVPVYEESFPGSGIFVEINPDDVYVEEVYFGVDNLDISDYLSKNNFWDDSDSSYFIVMD